MIHFFTLAVCIVLSIFVNVWVTPALFGDMVALAFTFPISFGIGCVGAHIAGSYEPRRES